MRKLLAVMVAVLLIAGILGAARLIFRNDEAAAAEFPGPVRSVDVHVEAGTVEVVGVPGEAARVRKELRFGGRRPHTSETLQEGALVVRADCRSDFLFQCRVDYRLEVPSGVSVRARSNAGNIRIDSVSGGVDAETNAGRVRLGLVSGPVKLRSDAGTIEGRDLQSPDVDAQTDAGRVQLVLVTVPERVVAKTSAGSIDLTIPDAAYRVDADTEVGRVQVDVAHDPQSSRTITAETDAGSIRIRRGPAR